MAPKYSQAVVEIDQWLQTVMKDIDSVLQASKDNPIDRNTAVVDARDSLVHALLNVASLMSVIVTQLNTAYDRTPFRDRISTDAIGTSLLIANGLQEVIFKMLKRSDEGTERRANLRRG